MVSPLPAGNLRSRERLGLRRLQDRGSLFRLRANSEISPHLACAKEFFNEWLSTAPYSVKCVSLWIQWYIILIFVVTLIYVIGIGRRCNVMYIYQKRPKKATGPPSCADADGHFPEKLENGDCEHFFLLIPQYPVYPHHLSTCIVF